MIPTKRGLSVALVGVVLYGLAWVTSIGWFFVADALVWATLIVNLPLPWLNARGFTAERRLAASNSGNKTLLFEDDSVTVEIRLRSRSVLPKFFVAIRETCPLASPDEQQKGFLIGTVLPRGLARMEYETRCYKRGDYTFGPLSVETSAPFGLFRSRRSVAAPLAATVYPQVLPLAQSFSPGPLEGSALGESLPQPTGEFRGSRQFQPTDHPRAIHWRNSAKRGELMVREFDHMPQGEVRLAFDPGTDLGQGRESTLEYAIKIAASLAGRCHEDGRPFRMWPQGWNGPMTSWYAVLDFLARMESAPYPSVQRALSLSHLPGTTVVAVSSSDQEAIQLLSGHRAGAVTTVVLLEGFGKGEDESAASVITRAGYRVVTCRPGGLRGALDSLTAAMSAVGANASRPGIQVASAVGSSQP